MARVRELGVWLHGRRVATVRAPKTGRVTCEYTAETLAEPGWHVSAPSICWECWTGSAGTSPAPPDHAQGRGKYEAHGGPSFWQVSDLLDKWSVQPREERLRLLDRATFTVAIGDADAHGKDLEILHPQPGLITLAPLYDTVPTMAWPKLRAKAAMSIGGVTRLPEVDRDALIRGGVSWGLSPDIVTTRIDDLLGRLRDVLSGDDGGVPAMGLVKRRVESLSVRP
jgi:hypothetical protein